MVSEALERQRADESWTPPLIAHGQWRAAAACRSADPDLFFPISDSGPALEQAAKAQAICATCRVRSECLAFALRTEQVYGIWGGTSERERAAARRGTVSEGPPASSLGPRLGASAHQVGELVLGLEAVPFGEILELLARDAFGQLVGRVVGGLRSAQVPQHVD
jgi:WhiB family transcriptional regulator, redox-sensing transcriptional regulator